jgi:TPR repeat protein
MYNNDTRQMRRLPDADTSLPRMLRRGLATRSVVSASTTPASYHLRQGLRGFVCGLVVVVPAVLWHSGTFSKAQSGAGNFRSPAVVISPVAVRPLSTAEPTAAFLSSTATVSQTGTPSTAERVAAPSAALERSHIADRLIDAHGLIRDGQIERARELLSDAAMAANAEAAYLLAETFDPNLLAALGITGVSADAIKARELYTRALAGGVTTARQRLQSLH